MVLYLASFGEIQPSREKEEVDRGQGLEYRVPPSLGDEAGIFIGCGEESLCRMYAVTAPLRYSNLTNRPGRPSSRVTQAVWWDRVG